MRVAVLYGYRDLANFLARGMSVPLPILSFTRPEGAVSAVKGISRKLNWESSAAGVPSKKVPFVLENSLFLGLIVAACAEMSPKTVGF